MSDTPIEEWIDPRGRRCRREPSRKIVVRIGMTWVDEEILARRREEAENGEERGGIEKGERDGTRRA